MNGIRNRPNRLDEDGQFIGQIRTNNAAEATLPNELGSGDVVKLSHPSCVEHRKEDLEAHPGVHKCDASNGRVKEGSHPNLGSIQGKADRAHVESRNDIEPLEFPTDPVIKPDEPFPHSRRLLWFRSKAWLLLWGRSIRRISGFAVLFRVFLLIRALCNRYKGGGAHLIALSI